MGVCVFDLDWTILDPTKRRQVAIDAGFTRDENRPKYLEISDHESLYHLDEPIDDAAEIVSKVASFGFEVLYLTGRWNGYRKETEKWLASNEFPTTESATVELIMAPLPAADKAKTYIPEMKLAVFEELLRLGKAVHFFVDDSPYNREIATRLGIPVFSDIDSLKTSQWWAENV